MAVEKTEDKKAAVKIKGLCKSYDGCSVYEDFDFTLEAGKVTAITGPSGCGKTTLLRMLCGLEEPDSGEIVFQGSEKEESAQTGGEKTAVVFQEDRLLPWLTVRENLELVLSGDKETERETGNSLPEDNLPEDSLTAESCSVESVIDLLGLSGFENYYPEALSGGMKRRVAIGRALLYGGRLILLDEPFKGLDSELKSRVMELLQRQWKASCATVLLITHHKEDAEFLADSLWEFRGRPVHVYGLF